MAIPGASGLPRRMRRQHRRIITAFSTCIVIASPIGNRLCTTPSIRKDARSPSCGFCRSCRNTLRRPCYRKVARAANWSHLGAWHAHSGCAAYRLGLVLVLELARSELDTARDSPPSSSPRSCAVKLLTSILPFRMPNFRFHSLSFPLLIPFPFFPCGHCGVRIKRAFTGTRGLVGFCKGRRGVVRRRLLLLFGVGMGFLGQKGVAKVSLMPFDFLRVFLIIFIIIFIITFSFFGSATIFCGRPASGLGL